MFSGDCLLGWDLLGLILMWFDAVFMCFSFKASAIVKLFFL